MSGLSNDYDDLQLKQGLPLQILTAVFVGVPLTVGLVIALSAYCTFQYARHLLFPKPQPVTPSSDNTEENFTLSLASLGRIHGVTQKIETATIQQTPETVEAKPVSSTQKQ